MQIKVLDKEVVAKIAAGEVVERPASVVKELVENSLDAGSSQISIEVRGGGVSLMRVTDNGCGIPSAELELAFKRHSTSKISSFDDLKSITSLGFRGEALPSIAAVAQVDIASYAAGESSGGYLALEEGKVVSCSSQGRPQGTTVTVRNLFHSLPARLKFLKSQATENGHIANVVSHYALAFPEVKFSMSIDGRASLRTPGRGHLLDSVIEVYGLEVASNMLEIGGDQEWLGEVAGSSIKVDGLVGSPKLSRSNRSYISLFINRRWVSSRMISWAVEEAYHGLLMTGKHPLSIVNISLPSEEIDVNIHPAKTEVKFKNERAVFTSVQKAVRQTLVKMTPVPRIEEVATTYNKPAEQHRLSHMPVGGSLDKTLPLVEKTPAVTLPVLRVLGQLLSSYIIAEGPDGLYLIDQHAAHERVLFEKVRQQKETQHIEVQGLLEPSTFEATPEQDEALEQRCGDLAQFGFSIEPFGDRTYLVRAVPALLYDKGWAEALTELLDLASGIDSGEFTEKVIASMACHSAVRFGQKLTDSEMRELIRQLEQATLPNACPHGRPTMIHISSGQLRKEFGRI
jgi:DNA mismatch repair protein MutL